MSLSALGFKIAIPSSGRAATIKTPRIVGSPVSVVVHDNNDAAWYRRNPCLAGSEVLVSGCPPGIARQRNWILDNLVDPGEWVLMLDDNIDHFQKVPEPYYRQEELAVDTLASPFWRRIYNTHANWLEMAPMFRNCIAKAEQIGAFLIGFASNDNYFFRARKWRTVGFVMTKMALVKRTHLRFDEEFTAKDDVEFSAANLRQFGRVLINNYARAQAAHFQAGGIGRQEHRIQASMKDAARLLEKYPHFFRYSLTRKPLKSEVLFKVTTEAQVERIRSGKFYFATAPK